MDPQRSSWAGRTGNADVHIPSTQSTPKIHRFLPQIQQNPLHNLIPTTRSTYSSKDPHWSVPRVQGGRSFDSSQVLDPAGSRATADRVKAGSWKPQHAAARTPATYYRAQATTEHCGAAPPPEVDATSPQVQAGQPVNFGKPCSYADVVKSSASSSHPPPLESSSEAR
jgi:hypothetical protein